MYCPHPQLGFEGWDFDHPLMNLTQTIPGTANQFNKSLVIAQPVMQWDADNKPVLDPKNKTGLGWMSMMTVTKNTDPNKASDYGCVVTATYNHVPTGAEKQSLQTMYNTIKIAAQSGGPASTADIIRYVNQPYSFTLDMPKTWQSIKEENVTTALNSANPNPFHAVLRLSSAKSPTNTGKVINIYIYDRAKVTNPTISDQAGMTYLAQNEQYVYYWGAMCDAANKIVPDCSTDEELQGTNTELGKIMKKNKLN